MSKKTELILFAATVVFAVVFFSTMFSRFGLI